MKVLISFFSESPNSENVEVKEKKKRREHLFFAFDDNFSVMLICNFYTSAFYLTSKIFIYHVK